jgi:flagellar protein FliL
MSAAAAAEPVADGAVPKKGKKKLIIMLVAALLLLGGIGGGAYWYFVAKKHAEAAAAEEEDGEESAAAKPAHKKAAKIDPKAMPTYVPLEPFVVNLADRDADRFAQIGITLQVDDVKFAEQMKGYMPAIRNRILMVLAHKTSSELLERDGKEALAAELMREAVRPMGIDIPTDAEQAAQAAAEEEAAAAKKAKKKASAAEGDPEADDEAPAEPVKKKKKKKAPVVHNPVTSVHFSSFIIQ